MSKNKKAFSGSLMLSEGSAPGVTEAPLTGTKIDHLIALPDSPSHDATVDAALTTETPMVNMTTGIAFQYSELHEGLNSRGPEGRATRITGDIALEPNEGPVSRLYAWYTEKNIDIKNGPELDLNSVGAHITATAIPVADDSDLTLAGGFRLGTFDPEMAQVTAALTTGKILTEAGVVHSLGDQNDQLFVGGAYRGEKNNAHVRQYIDVGGNNGPTDTTRTQWNLSHKLSDTASIHTFGTLSEGDGLKIREALAGVTYAIDDDTSLVAEGGARIGFAPTSPLGPAARAGVVCRF